METDLRYPIGQYDAPDPITTDHLRGWIEEIKALPGRLRPVVAPLSAEQRNTPYRPGGWNVNQVVHHLADSHINSLVRFKLALTEDKPTIKTYQEDRWGELPDVLQAPAEVSLDLLDALHHRWGLLLDSLQPDEFGREFVHPEVGTINVARMVGMYAWHGRHHLAHIQGLCRREGW